ncbi:hypothetical protein [Candidatus Spongiihabitans sp.]
MTPFFATADSGFYAKITKTRWLAAARDARAVMWFITVSLALD